MAEGFGVEVFVPSGLLRSFEPVLQSLCSLQGHQTSQPVNCWLIIVVCMLCCRAVATGQDHSLLVA